MSLISSLLLVDNMRTMQQCGSKKVAFTCPKALHTYNEYMRYADLVDFVKKKEDCLQKKVVSRNDKKGYLGVMDFMMVNNRIAWNMSAKLKGVFRTTLNNSTWRMYVAKHMLT